MKEFYIRIWVKKDLNEIKKHLMVIDDFYGICANCKEPNLNFVQNKICPKCKTEFKYITSNNKAQIGKILNRIELEKLSLVLLEKEDWDKAIAKQSMNSIFQ